MTEEKTGVVFEGLPLNIPMQGNAGAADTDINTQTPEQKAAAEAASKVQADAAAKAAAEGNKGGEGDKDKTPNPDGTDEQIQAKLDELAKLDETKLTDDQKKFIEKYTADNSDEITTVKQHFETKWGIKVDGEFTNDIEGFTQLSEKVGSARAKQMLINHLETVPYMKAFYDHVVVEKRGIETFLDKNKQPEFKTIKLEQVNDSNDATKNEAITSNQRAIITMDLKSKGNSAEEIDIMLKHYEDKGVLYDKSVEAQKGLDVKYKANLDAKLAAEKAAIDAEEAENKATFTKVISMIDSNNFGGVSIPAEDIKVFKEAMTKVIDEEGHTVMDYKRAKLTLEQRAMLDYFVFKDLKVPGLGTPKAANKVFTFKKAAKDNEDRGGGRARNGGESNSQQQQIHPKFDMSNITIQREN